MANYPLVSICCITYNHENYIREAIEGFLIQKTNFPIEIIIHDDASTDNTANIIKEYEKKHSAIIKPIYQSENQWSKGIKPSPTHVWPKARGKYIALCEGDDYWTDPYKLQKQVDFLENNPEYGLVHTDFDAFVEKKNYLIRKVHKKQRCIIDSFDKYWDKVGKQHTIKTLTVCLRKKILYEYKDISVESIKRNWPVGDFPLFLFISYKYKIGFIKDSTSVYRVGIETACNFNNINRRINYLESFIDIRNYFLKKIELDTTGFIKPIYRDYFSILMLSIINGDKKRIRRYYGLLKGKRFHFISLFIIKKLNYNNRIKYAKFYNFIYKQKHKLINPIYMCALIAKEIKRFF